MVTVAEIWIFPVKSCRGIRVGEAVVRDPRGFDGDRELVIADANGQFLTQRELPELARIHTAIDARTVTLRAAGAAELVVPRHDESGPRRSVVVWNDTVEGVEHAHAAPWLERVLGRPAALVAMRRDAPRPVDAAYGRPGDVVSFADAFPFLVASRASLAALAPHFDEPDITMERFRANLVLDGCEPWFEDTLGPFTVGAVPFEGVKRCSRCAIPAVDPDTARRGKEPTRTLAALRKADDGRVYFGMNAIARGTGRVRVGDPLVAVEAPHVLPNPTTP